MVPENNTQNASPNKCSRTNSFYEIFKKTYKSLVKKLVFRRFAY